LPEYLRADRAAGLDAFDVIARCIPMQKLELVRALQAAGETVAVTGDGVNDVPALQGADIGIAMGERGTRSAREVASIVLLDDDFRTIINAISEGRQLFENLKRSFAYLLMVHIPLVLTAAFIPFAGYPLLYLPVHIVWFELMIHPTALLVFPQLPASDRLVHIKRGMAHRRFFDRIEWTVIAIVGLLVTTSIVLGYVRSLGPTQNIEHARSMAMIVLIVSSAAVTLGLSGVRARSALLAAAAALLSAIVFVQVDPLARMLHLEPLHADDWLLAGAAGLLPGIIAGFISWRARRARIEV
jgi:Ca2+-transporting ATPase